MAMQPSKRGVALLISLLLLSISTSTVCSASKVRAPRRKQQQPQPQRRLGKSSHKEKAPKGTTVAKEVANLKEEESMFFGEEESFSEEITHDAAQELKNIEEHSGLGGMEGFATMEHNSDKEEGKGQGEEKAGKKEEESKKEEKTDKVEEGSTKEEKEKDTKEEPESESDSESAATVEEEDVSEGVEAPKDESNKGQGKEKVSNSPGTSHMMGRFVCSLLCQPPN